MRVAITVYLVAFFTVGVPAVTYGAPPAAKSGDVAKNLKLLPLWTLRLCPTVLHATYTAEGALALKRLDNDCALWKGKAGLLDTQAADFNATAKTLRAVIDTFKAEQKLDATRQAALMTQLKTEIAEKNKYKYEPNYGWLYIAIGAALAAAGLAFGVGVWVAK